MRRTALMFVLAGLVGALVGVPIAVHASHKFTDVPDSHPFHGDIDWLANAGVTKGCTPTEYCPEDNVTREQMAAFMRRLAGNRVVDAGRLAGSSAEDFVDSGRVLSGSVSYDATETTGAVTKAEWFPVEGLYKVEFAGSDLRDCSGTVAIGPNSNTSIGSQVPAMSILALGLPVTPLNAGQDDAVVGFQRPADSASVQNPFHLIVICPD